MVLAKMRKQGDRSTFVSLVHTPESHTYSVFIDGQGDVLITGNVNEAWARFDQEVGR